MTPYDRSSRMRTTIRSSGYSHREVADLLSVSPETVLRRWRSGELPGFRLATNVLRFDADELDAWLEQRRQGAPYTLSRP